MRIEIARAFVPVEVDLWGEVFQTVDVPRSGAKKAQDIETQLEGLNEDDQDAAVGLLAQLIDLKLVSANGKKTKPSTLLKAKWKTDELTMRQLWGFIESIKDAEGTAQTDGRPT